MPSISTTVEINRPIEEVFEYLTNLDNAPEWSVELVEVTHDGPFRLGATGTDVRMMGKNQVSMPWTVTEFSPPHRMVLAYTEPFPINAAFLFASTASGGTQVTCNTEMEPKGRWRLLSPMMAREGAKTDRTQFEKVKEILESRPT
jgi:uncharacterized protein YndB with AHSA1/START domain